MAGLEPRPSAASGRGTTILRRCFMDKRLQCDLLLGVG
jgi:hypothetical protein